MHSEIKELLLSLLDEGRDSDIPPMTVELEAIFRKYGWKPGREWYEHFEKEAELLDGTTFSEDRTPKSMALQAAKRASI